MTATKNKLSGKLLALIMIGLATCSFTPIIKHPLIFLFFGVLALYLIRIHSDASGYRRNPRLVICVYLYICVCIIYRLLEISDASFGEILKHILFFIPILLMLLLSDKLTERQSRWIFWIIIVVVLMEISDASFGEILKHILFFIPLLLMLFIFSLQSAFFVSSTVAEKPSGISYWGVLFFLPFLFLHFV